MAEIKCPVCGKTGIPDYRVQDTTCPQCGADLSIYKLAHDIESVSTQSGENKKKHHTWIIPVLFACCLAIALVCSTLSNSRARKELKAFEKENAVLQAKVSELQQAKVDTSAHQTEQSTPFVYTVRRGDSFWLISKRLYGTGTRYREIAESNGMTPESKLNIGDKLIIK